MLNGPPRACYGYSVRGGRAPLPGSPGLAGSLQRRHIKAPDAQGSRHGEEHSQPAAGHDERHEQAKVVDGRDLAMGK